MRALVCGSRDWRNRERLYSVLDSWPEPITEVIEGAARGADTMAFDWAWSRGIPVRPFPADWKNHGKSAGPRRNTQMLMEGEPAIVIAFSSRPGTPGTTDMMRQARKAGIPCHEFFDLAGA